MMKPFFWKFWECVFHVYFMIYGLLFGYLSPRKS